MVSENSKSIFKSGADTTRSLINIGSKIHHVLWIPFGPRFRSRCALGLTRRKRAYACYKVQEGA